MDSFSDKWNDKYTIHWTISKLWEGIQALKLKIICDFRSEQEVPINSAIPVELIKIVDNSGYKTRKTFKLNQALIKKNNLI